MTEPILTREEVEALAHRICARYVHSENVHLRQYTFGITTLEQFAAAVLEKVCGEPIYQARQRSDDDDRWDDVYEATHFACSNEPKFYETRIVYSLTRSKP
jgi:hypothetical protein